MIEEIEEKEFVKRYGEDFYRELVEDCYFAIRQSTEWINDKPDFYSILTFPGTTEGKECLFICVVTAKKFGNGYADFGIVNIYLTDEKMPDKLLDLYNEIKGKSHTVKFNP